MHFLITNDDGYQARGIQALSQTLASVAEVTLVAPNRNRSASSNSLTLERPIRASHHDHGVVSVDGTPTDCVHLAITGLLDSEPDMVIAGINAGANLGDDVLYSGTVAAAMEGRFLGLPAIAVSLASTEEQNFETAAQVALDLIRRLDSHSLPKDMILNINVPDVSMSQLAGYRSTRLGHRHRAEPVVRMTDPRGKPIYWIGAAGGEADAGPGTDFHAVNHRFVSVTPLQVDLTRYNALDIVAGWLPPDFSRSR